jgi:hypothetical protein
MVRKGVRIKWRRKKKSRKKRVKEILMDGKCQYDRLCWNSKGMG